MAEVLAGPILVHGPRVQTFETAFAEFAGGGHAVALASCTAALHLAYFHLGLGPGDELVVPAQTHVATAHAVELVGARPVFVDAEPATGNIDLDRLAGAITSRTRAISVVHYLGRPVDMVRVNDLARRHGLFVVEDAALGLGTRLDGSHAGLMGDVGCFSFYPVKHMTTAEGGMLLTRHADLAEGIRAERAFGLDRTVTERSEPGIYDVTALGLNYRMNELAAALGLVQLGRVPDFLSVRAENYARLGAGLAKLDELTLLAPTDPRMTHSHYCLVALLAGRVAGRRADVVRSLKAQGVGSSVYYPGPLPLMTYYRKKYGHRPGEFPVAEAISQRSIALPVGPHLDGDDMDAIVAAMKKAINDVP